MFGFIFKYKFKDKFLLLEALTHSSFKEGVSFGVYWRLHSQSIQPGQVSHLRAANTSTVCLGLHRCICHNAPPLVQQVATLCGCNCHRELPFCA